jgi:hypothetical protein
MDFGDTKHHLSRIIGDRGAGVDVTYVLEGQRQGQLGGLPFRTANPHFSSMFSWCGNLSLPH